MPIISLNTPQVEKYTYCKDNKNKQEETKKPKPSERNSLVSRNEDDYWVDISARRLGNSRLGALYDGSQFKGVQKCGSNKYNVLVDIKVIKRHAFVFLILTFLFLVAR